MFNISVATEKDIPAIIDLASKTWWHAYSGILSVDQIEYMLSTLYAKEAITREMNTGTQTFLLLTEDNVNQAFASYGKRPEDVSVHKLHKLYVLPRQQGKGYGKALILDVRDRLLRDDFHILELNVNRDNPAQHFYKKLGFTVLRREDIPIGPYWMNDYVMRLEF